MHDIKFIRETPDAFDAAMKRRKVEVSAADLLAVDEQRRALTVEMNDLQAERNTSSKMIGAAKGQGDDAEADRLMQKVATLKEALTVAEDKQKALSEDLDARLMSLPNILDTDVPDGVDEEDNQALRQWGTPQQIAGAKQHFELGEALASSTGPQMDFDVAAKLSGARFVVLKKDMARLERALANFMLDLHTQEFGYEEVNPPVLVRDDALYGTGQLPKFEEDLFKTTGDHYLTPTAEVTLTNLVRESILAEKELPKRFTAWTQCFRSEAGSAGRDTRGMIRMHQFSKVELVSITTPDESKNEHERMVGCAEEVLKKLDLPFRTMTLCSGDTGFGARKTYDIEVWLPGANDGNGQYREISSCSNCGDFQARRMKARYRIEGEKQPHFVHTLNGSGLAVGRTLVAVLENYQQADGTIAVPTALQSYLGGQKSIAGG